MTWRESRDVSAHALDTLARAAHGRVLVLGHVRVEILAALWQQRPCVDHIVADGEPYVRAARDAGAIGYAWRGIAFVDAADTVVIDADRVAGSVSFAEVRARLHSGGTLLLFGATGRPATNGPGVLASRAGVFAALTEAGFSVSVPAIADARHTLVVASAPGDRRVEVRVSASAAPVTVCIPSAGRSPWLKESIESVLDQHEPPESILVVSDGGGDTVRSVLGAYPNVARLDVPKGGQAAAMNAALEHVSTPYVAWLDDDDRFLPQKLAVQWRDLEAHPNAAFGATDHLVIDTTGTVVERGRLPEFDPEQTMRLLLGGSFFLGPTVMVPMSRYRELGTKPYDETLPRAADYPVWMALASSGPVRVVPLALSEIRRHRDNRLTPERIAGMRQAARRTHEWVRSAWPLERLFPAIDAARTEAERSEARAVALIERAGHGLRVGLVEEAVRDLREGLAARPDDARLRHFLALSLMESGDLAEAAVAFEAAGRVGAPPAEVACGLGTIAVWEGDREAAARWFDRARAADPGSVIARYNAVWLSRESGDALELCRDLLSGGRPHGYLLSPAPPLPPTERELVRLRRTERGLPDPD